jgi:hypothetical protein
MQNKIKNQQGGITIGFCIVLGAILTLFVILIQTQTYLELYFKISDSVETAADYAEYLHHPFSAVNQSRIENIVRTGSTDASQPLLTHYWNSPGAQLDLTHLSSPDRLAIDVSIPFYFAISLITVPVRIHYEKEI